VSDPRILTVDWAAESTKGGIPHWAVHFVDQDGTGGGYRIHREAFEWRAAEYGLTDIDEIIDMVLHEFHLPDEPDRDDAAARVGYVTSTGPSAEPVTLFNATSTPDALAAHRLRIAEAKRVTALFRPPVKGKDPLDAIRSRHGITAAGVRTKRELVDVHRWHLLYGDLPVQPRSMALEVPRA
jgi:hypothetical protein